MEPAAILRLLITAEGVKETQLQLARLNEQAKRTADSNANLEKTVTRLDDRMASLSRSSSNARAGLVGLAPAAIGIVSTFAQATAGAAALGVAVGGATVAFGVLGKAVVTSIGDAVKNNAALTAAQQKYQQALQGGSKAAIASAKANLQAAQQAVKAQGAAATQVAKDWVATGDTVKKALLPAVSAVERGLSAMLQSIQPAVAGLSKPFLALGNQIRSALDDPAVQGGVKQLIYDFGRMVKATAPLVGPVLNGIIQLGDTLINIARAAMPDLVKLTQSFANHMAAVNSFTRTDKFRSMIHNWDQQFVAVLKTVGKLAFALGPLFSQKSEIGKGFLWVIGEFAKLLHIVLELTNKMGVLGQVIGAGLGLAVLSGRLGGVVKAATGLAGIFKALPKIVDVAKGALGGLTAFIAANPLALPFTILAGAITLALTHLKEFKRGAEELWNGIKTIFGHGVSAILSIFSTFLHGLGSVLDAISNVPGLGWVGDLAKDVNHAGDSIDKLREKLDGLGNDSTKTGKKVATSWGSASENLQRAITDMLHNYGDFHDKVGTTNQSLQKNFNTAYALIESYIKTHTGKAKAQAEDNLHQLQLAFGRYMNDSSHSTNTNMTNVQNSVASHTKNARDIGSANMHQFQQDVSHWLDVTHKNTGDALTAIAGIVGSKTEQANQQGSAHMRSFQQNTTHSLTTAKSSTGTNMTSIASIVGSKSAQSAAEAKTNFGKFAANIHGGMLSGANATYRGVQYIEGAVSKGLSALGSAIKVNVSLSIPKFAQGGEVTKAAKGLYQFGQAGAAGHDNIPVNFGGRSIMVGNGEMGAVFTRHQKEMADRFMAPIGGLTGLFNNVTKPHYMATGGYVFPFPPGTTLGRTDQGVDANMPVGAPIGGIGPGHVLNIQPNWYAGQPSIWFQLDAGPMKGRIFYLAEQVTPAVHAGSRWTSGHTAIAHYAPSGTGIEMGFGATGDRTLAQATSGYSEGAQTPAGIAFRNFIMGLAHGKLVGGGLGAIANIIAPHVKGGGYLGKMVQVALDKTTSAANAYVAAHAPTFGAPGAIGSIPPNTGNVERDIYKTLSARGWNKVAIAAAIGNAAQESALNPASVGSGGGGLWGFTSGAISLAALQAAARARGVPWTDVPFQSAFMAAHYSDLAALNAYRDPREAALYFMNTFEHPYAPAANIPHREAAAAQAYAQGYSKGGFLPPFGGVFHNGGTIPGPWGAERTIIAKGGETVSTNATGGGPLVYIDQFVANDNADIRTLGHQLAWLIES